MYSTPRLPDAISHRGLHTDFAENSIPAFEAAIAAGADGIELDVHASADEVLFVHHDACLTRGDVQRPIRALESAQLAAQSSEAGTRIPTLDDALEAIGSRARVFVEIKATGIESAVTRCFRRHAATADNYAVHAFDHRVAKRMLELIPTVRTGVLQVSYLVDSCAAMRAAGASDLWQQAEFIDEALVIGVHSCGGRVIAWTANSDGEWAALASKGVDGICTDRVDLYSAWRSARNRGA